jgi:hypothetical protein
MNESETEVTDNEDENEEVPHIPPSYPWNHIDDVGRAVIYAVAMLKDLLKRG